MDDEKGTRSTRRELWKGAVPLAAGAAALAAPLAYLLAPADPPEAGGENGGDGLPPAASPGTPRLPVEARPDEAARISPLAGTR
jgi:hypothetical protein